MNPFAKAGLYLVLIAGLFGAGFFSGWTEKSIRIEAAKVAPLQEARKNDQAAVVQSIKDDHALSAKNDASAQVVNDVQQEIKKHVPVTKPPRAVLSEIRPEQPATADVPVEDQVDEVAGDCPSDVLSINAVRLLNASTTAEADFDPTAYIDEEGQALTGIGMRELSDHYLKTVKVYRELAANHDALVEYQEQQIEAHQQSLE